MGFNVAKQREHRVTYEGGRAYAHKGAREELYLLACSSLMVADDTFYEPGADRLERFRSLIATVAAERDGPEFLAALTAYARDCMHLRTTPTVLAAELFYTSADYRVQECARDAARRAWVRGDEHLEALAYVDGLGYKRRKDFLRAVADRLNNLTQRQAVKYAGGRRSYSQADAIRLAHPKPVNDAQSALFKHLCHGWDALSEAEQGLLPEVAKVQVGAVDDREWQTWEQLISVKGSSTGTWTEAVSLMGYMALIRNLRNLIDHKVSPTVLSEVSERLADPDQVRRSKQLPFRYLSALRALHHGGTPPVLIDALSRAMDASVANVPELEGDSLILVDTSGSMQQTVGGRSQVSCADAASCLGAILAHRGNADLWAFATSAQRLMIPAGTPCLMTVAALERANVGWSTNIGDAIRSSLRTGLRRIIVLTDMQAHDAAMAPTQGYLADSTDTHVYVVDLCGYGLPSFDPRYPRVHIVSGFSDRVFEWMAAVETADPVKLVNQYVYAEEVE